MDAHDQTAAAARCSELETYCRRLEAELHRSQADLARSHSREADYVRKIRDQCERLALLQTLPAPPIAVVEWPFEGDVIAVGKVRSSFIFAAPGGGCGFVSILGCRAAVAQIWGRLFPAPVKEERDARD